jgi:hypothetical protein
MERLADTRARQPDSEMTGSMMTSAESRSLLMRGHRCHWRISWLLNFAGLCLSPVTLGYFKRIGLNVRQWDLIGLRFLAKYIRRTI